MNEWFEGLPSADGYYWLGIENDSYVTLVQIYYDADFKSKHAGNSGFLVKKFDTVHPFTIESYGDPSYRWRGPIEAPRGPK